MAGSGSQRREFRASMDDAPGRTWRHMADRRAVMAGLSFTWELRYRGWAFCTISDDHSRAEVTASDVTGGPEYFLRAVTAITQGAETAQAAFEAEPTEFRWSFRRSDSDVEIRLSKAPDRSSSDSE